MENLIGKDVINIHRNNPIAGEILRFEEGINGGAVVKWNGQDWESPMVLIDLVLVDDAESEDPSRRVKRLSDYFPDYGSKGVTL